MLSTPVATATATPTWRATASRVFGTRATSSAPTAGRTMRLVRIGNPAVASCAASAASTGFTAQPPAVLWRASPTSGGARTKERASEARSGDEEGHQEDGAGGDAEGVVADVAGLHHPEAGAAGPDHGGDPVDEA